MDKSQIEIITTSIEAAMNSELWYKTIDLYVDYFGCVSGAISVVDNEYSERSALAISRFIREDAFEAYRRYMNKEDTDDYPALDALFRLPPNLLTSELDVFGVSNFKDMPYSSFREWKRKEFDIQQRYGLRFNNSGPWCDIMFLHVDGNKYQLSKSEIQTINTLSQITSSSLKTFRVLEQLRAQFDAALNALDNLGMASFLAIGNGQIIHKNLSAGELIDNNDGLSLKQDGYLVTESAEQDLMIKEFCANAYAAAKAEAYTREIVFELKRPSNNPSYLVVINPLIDTNGELETGLQMSIIFIIDPTTQRDISIEGLKKIGNLTEAEQKVCQMVVNGLSTDTISQRRNVEKNTVQQQIKKILTKLHCNNRIELLRFAVDTQLPIKKQ